MKFSRPLVIVLLVLVGALPVLGAVFPPLTAKFTGHDTGPSVTQLQQMLAADGVYSATPSGSYDQVTTEAVARFQQKYNLPTTPETLGFAGPSTRAKLNALYAEGGSPPVPSSTSGGSAPASANTEALVQTLRLQLLSLLQQLLGLLQKGNQPLPPLPTASSTVQVSPTVTPSGSTSAVVTSSLHQITASTGAGGRVTPLGQIKVEDGKDKTFTITADAGFTIDRVTIDGQAIASAELGAGGASYTFKKVKTDHTINVTFKTTTTAAPADTVTLTTTAQDGQITRSSTQSAYPTNTTITLTAVPNAGFQFVGWSGDASGTSNPLSVVLNKNKSITANFSPLSYAIVASAGSGGAISPAGSTPVQAGANQTFTITTTTGYSIASVLIDGQAVAIASTYTFQDVRANHTIAVTFSTTTTTPVESPSVTYPTGTILPAGSGFSGATAQPATRGSSSQTGYDAKAIARWDVIPYQTFDTTFNVGVVAFHIADIDRVEFSANGGAWTAIDRMTTNPQSGVKEYWATVRASDFPDGQIELRAVVYPKVGIPRVLAGAITSASSALGEHSIFLFANANHSFVSQAVYVGLSGADTNPGTAVAPFATIKKALSVVKDGGTIILLDAGSYAVDGPSTYVRPTRWITIKPRDGLTRDQVVIAQPTRTGIRPFVNLLKWQGLAFDFHTVAQYYGEAGSLLWFDNVHWYDSGGWTSIYTGNTGRVSAYVAATYVTDSLAEEMEYGFTSTSLLRNSHMYRISGDAFQNSRLILNSDVDTMATVICWTNASGAKECTHNDILQYWSSATNNIIIYGVEATNIKETQGVFITGEPLQDVAVVNVDLDTNDPGGGPAFSQMGGTNKHYLLINLQLPKQKFIIRNDALLSTTNVLFKDCTLYEALGTLPPNVTVKNCVDRTGKSIDGIGLPPDTIAPTAPTNLAVTSTNANAVALSWSAATDNVAVTNYKVYRDGTAVATVNKTTYTNTGLTPLTTYRYTVAAVDKAGNVSPLSGEVSATTLDAASGTTAPSVSDHDASLGLLGRWSFDSGSVAGTTAQDDSGNGNDAELAQIPTLPSGKIGQALQLDGSTQWAEAPASGSLNVSSSVTVAGWVNAANTTGGVILARGCTYSGASAEDYALFLYSGNRLKMDISDGSSVSSVLSPTSQAAGTWYHVAGVYDGSSVTLYLNGVQSGTTATTLTHLNSTTGKKIGIGRDLTCSRATLTGLLDDVRVYNTALSASELQALYAQARSAHVDPLAQIKPANNLAASYSAFEIFWLWLKQLLVGLGQRL